MLQQYKKEGIILKAENISLEYERPILRDVNFDIYDILRPNMTQGQVVSLIGRSGIGKCLKGNQKITIKISDELYKKLKNKHL